jgi:two-component system phosphate regulon response regulator PhoB
MASDNILVVDDEEDILELVRYNLSQAGYRVRTSTSGEAALRMTIDALPDLIVLDLMLPGIDGLEVARRLKKNSDTSRIPIVMLTAKGEESDVVVGLEMGADDYVTKPFSPKILLARVKSVLRRNNQEETTADAGILTIRELVIHPGRRHVTVDGEPVELTFTEFQVLYHLARRPGWVFTRTQIVDAVRGEDYPVTDRSVDVQIVGLRKKLGRFGQYIQTVRGVGYRFIETV